MATWKQHLPKNLIYLRLVLGFIVLVWSFSEFNHFEWLCTILLTVGLLSDIFDGILARRWEVSTLELRKLDSTVDQLFFLCVTAAVFWKAPDFLIANSISLGILLGFEGLCYLFCLLKFQKEVATHTIGAKLWTILLFVTLLELIWQQTSHDLYWWCFWLGVVTRAEIVAIVLVLRVWSADVPSLYHAVLLRQNKPIRRSKWFNG